MIHRYNFPTEIHFGPGARRLIAQTLAGLGVKKPLLVTDANVAKLPFFADFAGMVENAAVFSGVVGNPVKAQAVAGLAAYRAHASDGIVAIGGGAAIDIGKTIALLVNHPGDLFDYEDGAPGAKPVDKEFPPVIALPTTAGTGSEVGRSSVVSDDNTHRKAILFSPKMLPKVVLADPELTVGLPPAITAATGMDALTHLIEAYTTIGGQNPLCDGIALEGLRLAARSLVRAVEHPGDLAARGDMLNAALMGAVAFQRGLGATHSCAHALSTVCDMHHGLANGIMLPYVMEFNRPAVEEKFKLLAKTVGAEDFCAWIEGLKASIGIPETLTSAGVSAEDLEPLVETALKDVCHALNPRPVEKEDFRLLFEAALS